MARQSARPKQSDPVAEWLESGRQLKKALEEERAQLLARLEEIEGSLLRLSAAEAQIGTAPTQATVPDLADKTIQDSIVAAIAAHPSGASLGDIRDWIRRGGKRVEPKHLPSYIYKLRKDEVITSKGQKGSMVYTIGSAPKEGDG